MSDIEIVVSPNGHARMIFDDQLDVRSIGSVSVTSRLARRTESCRSVDRRSFARQRSIAWSV